MLRFTSLTIENFGPFKGNQTIDFTNDNGVTIIWGNNGRGKTTLLNVISGLDSYEEGEMYIDGKETSHYLASDFEEYRKQYIGNIFQHFNLVNSYTVYQNVELILRINGYSKEDRKRRIAEILQRVGLAAYAKTKVSKLSGGQKQRISIARIFLKNPPVLILDEPTVGLDPKQIIEIRALIKKLGKNHTVILSSHILPEIQAVCDKIVIINRGRVVANDSADHLAKNMSADHKLVIRCEGNPADVKKLLSAIPGMDEVFVNRENVEEGVSEYFLNAKPGTDIRREVSKRLASRNYTLLMMKSSELTLEEVFLKITTGDIYGNVGDSVDKLKLSK